MSDWKIINGNLPFKDEFPARPTEFDEYPEVLWCIDNSLPFKKMFSEMYAIDGVPAALWRIVDGNLPFRSTFSQMHRINDAPESIWRIADDLPFKIVFPPMYKVSENDRESVRSYFIFKDTYSSEFGSIEILPLCLKHEEKTNYINFITGSPLVQETSVLRSKVITVTLNLDDTSPANIDKIISWLIGTGKLIFSRDPHRYYIATCNAALTGQRILSLGKVVVQFDVMPYKYDIYESDAWETVRLVEAVASQGCEIHYEGNAPSESVFKITGTGDFQIYSVQSGDYVEVRGLTDYCVIDLKKRKVTDENGDVILNRTYGDINNIKLVPGVNIFLISGDVTALQIKRRTRWY